METIVGNTGYQCPTDKVGVSGQTGVTGAARCPDCNGKGSIMRGKIKTKIFCFKCNGRGIVSSKSY